MTGIIIMVFFIKETFAEQETHESDFNAIKVGSKIKIITAFSFAGAAIAPPITAKVSSETIFKYGHIVMAISMFLTGFFIKIGDEIISIFTICLSIAL
tara:strand:- start:237 stop:530 length:294 start_codon:yes stop_codon:yes gene_type:complete